MVFNRIIFEFIRGEMGYVSDLGNIEFACSMAISVSHTEKYPRFTTDVRPTTTFDGPSDRSS